VLPVDLKTSKALIILLKSLGSIFEAETGSILDNLSYKYFLPCILIKIGTHPIFSMVYLSILRGFSLGRLTI